MGKVGSWDGFNPFITKDKAPAGLDTMSECVVYERLMYRSADEPFSLYGLLAQSVEVAADKSSITFNINPAARWADGKPVTAQDVIFSWQTLKEKGKPNLRLFYSRVQDAIELGPLKVIFHLKKTSEGIYDPELPMLIAFMTVLPKHIFQGKDFEKMTKDPVMGSGPYKIANYEMGKHITYERRDDYWGWKLPILQGLYNFKKVRFDYFGTEQVEFEAFKVGQTRIRSESDPKKWIKSYDFKAIKQGKVKKEEIAHTMPVGMYGLVFNTRREQFKDWRVRRAIGHLFDFKWINKNLLHDQATRTMTFFDNCELAPTGLPSGKELEILNRFKDKISPDVFTKEYKPASQEFNGNPRDNLRQAVKLMAEAGWIIKHNKLVNIKGEQFKFEIIVYDESQKKVAINFAGSLRKGLGMAVEIRNVDIPQFQKRLMTFDFDTTFFTWGHTLSPGREQDYYWNTKAADEEGSRNYPAIKNPVIDQLCNILATAPDRETLIAAAKALGRLLNWEEKILPLYHKNKIYMAYWDDLDHPKFNPNVATPVSSWWSKAGG